MKSSYMCSWTTFSLLLSYIRKGTGIGCFQCFSLDGNVQDCEDQFANYEKTGHIYKRDCRVGLLEFESFYCIKIKGVKKETGEDVLVRTCSVDDWGNVCGEIRFEQGMDEEPPTEGISGCLSTCDHDGCNTSNSIHRRDAILCVLLTLLLIWCHIL